jgi:large subunit ribosomal protein L27
VKVGEIIVRQRGMVYKPGDGVKMGKDHTLFSIKIGVVKFSKKLGKAVISVKEK